MKFLNGTSLLALTIALIAATLTVTVSAVGSMFGIDIRNYANGGTFLIAMLIGFGAAVIGLLASKFTARMMMRSGGQITEPHSHAEHVIFGSVQEIAQRLHITMPEVWVYDSPDPNAFATGPSKNNSMVAVSTGLLQNLKEDEVKAVLAHEMGHVFNGDMLTTTVLSGVMNTLVFLISNIAYNLVASARRNPESEDSGYPQYDFMASMVAQFVQMALSMLALFPISWFSRHREFAADAFSAKVYGKESMIGALRGIDRWVNRAQFEYASQDALATMKIAGNSSGFMHLFATHPPIEVRIAALERL